MLEGVHVGERVGLGGEAVVKERLLGRMAGAEGRLHERVVRRRGLHEGAGDHDAAGAYAEEGGRIGHGVGRVLRLLTRRRPSHSLRAGGTGVRAHSQEI